MGTDSLRDVRGLADNARSVGEKDHVCLAGSSGAGLRKPHAVGSPLASGQADREACSSQERLPDLDGTSVKLDRGLHAQEPESKPGGLGSDKSGKHRLSIGFGNAFSVIVNFEPYALVALVCEDNLDLPVTIDGVPCVEQQICKHLFE